MAVVIDNPEQIAAARPAAQFIEDTGTITGIDMVTSRFAQQGEERYALEFQIVRDSNNETIRVELELDTADRMVNGKTVCDYEETCKTLKVIGYQYDEDLSYIDTLNHVKVPVYCKTSTKNGKTYTNWYFSRGNNRAIDADTAGRKLKEMMAQFRAKRVNSAPIPAAPAAAPTAAQTTPSAIGRPNPFSRPM